MNLDRLTEEYVKQQDLIVAATARKEELKDLLKSQVEKMGSQDQTGHRWLPTDEWLLKLERRKGTPTFDEAAARQWAKDKGIIDSLETTVTPAPYTFFDQDKLAAWDFDHPEDREVIKSFFGETAPTYAFAKPTKQKKIDY